jgi:hypothetical protein
MAYITDPDTGIQYDPDINEIYKDPTTGAVDVRQKSSTVSSGVIDKSYIEGTINNLSSLLRGNLEGLISDYKRQGAEAKAKQEDVNRRQLAAERTAGFRSGRSQYATEHQDDILTKEENDGLQRLRDIDNKVAELIGAATRDFNEKNINLGVKKMELLRDLQKEQDSAAQALKKAMDAKNTELLKTYAEKKKNDAIYTSSLKQMMDKDGNIDTALAPSIDPFKLYLDANFNADGTPTGANATLKEIFDFVDNAQKSAGTQKEPTSQIGRYEYAKKKGWIDDKVSYFDFGEMEKGPTTENWTKTTWNGSDALLNTKTGKIVVAPAGRGEINADSPEFQPYLDAVANLSLLSGFREDQGKSLQKLVLDSLAQGDTKRAKEIIERAAYGRLDASDKDNYDLADIVKETSQVALDFIEKQKELKTGPYKNLFQRGATWAFLKRDPDLTELNFWIQISNAQVRRAFFGTAVTASEAGTANKFLITDTDDVDTLKIKLLGSMVFNDWVQEAKLARLTGLTAPSLQDKLAFYNIDISKLKTPPKSAINPSYDVPDDLRRMLGRPVEATIPQIGEIAPITNDYLQSVGY